MREWSLAGLIKIVIVPTFEAGKASFIMTKNVKRPSLTLVYAVAGVFTLAVDSGRLDVVSCMAN